MMMMMIISSCSAEPAFVNVHTVKVSFWMRHDCHRRPRLSAEITNDWGIEPFKERMRHRNCAHHIVADVGDGLWP